jgi:hypothetical protein
VLTVLRIQTHPIATTPVSLANVDIAATTGPDLVAPRRAAEPPILPIRLPRCSKCGHRKVLSIFIFDESGSVQSRSDPARPIANRRAETSVVIDHLGTCRCGNELIAFIYFDTGVHDLEPTPLTKAGAGILRDALANPAPATSSCMASALAKAKTIAGRYPDHDVVIVAYTDFELFDTDVDGVLAEFANVDARPHAVVLHSRVPEALESDRRVTVTHIRWDSTRGAVAQALLPTLGRHRHIDGQPNASAPPTSREASASS